MAGREKWTGLVVAALAGLLLGYAVLRILAPFVAALAAAAIVAVVAYPLHVRLLKNLSRSVSAGVVSGIVCAALAVPLTIGGWYLARESAHAYPLLRQAVESLAGAPDARVPAWIPAPARGYLQGLDLRTILLENVDEIGGWLARVARSAASSAALVVADVLIFVLALFAFLRGGRGMLERLGASLPLSEGAKTRIFGRAHETVIATIEGVFLVAVLQGALATIGFGVFGFGFPVLLGVLCGAFSPIPFIGPTVVWIPVAAKFALSGQVIKAALLTGWFALIVGTSDNIVRPILVGTRARLPVAVVVVGVLGGLKAFGPIGAFFGPVVMAVAVAVVDALLQGSEDEPA